MNIYNVNKAMFQNPVILAFIAHTDFLNLCLEWLKFVQIIFDYCFKITGKKYCAVNKSENNKKIQNCLNFILTIYLPAL